MALRVWRDKSPVLGSKYAEDKEALNMTVTLNLPPQVEQAYLEEWVAEFKARVHSHANENLPLLSDEAISRDFIYRERGL